MANYDIVIHNIVKLDVDECGWYIGKVTLLLRKGTFTT